MTTKLNACPPTGGTRPPTGGFHLYETRLGWIGLILSPKGLRATTLPRPSRDEALRDVSEMGALEPASENDAGDLPRRLRAFADGERVDLAADIDWSRITGFRRAVLEETMRIPAGGTRTYGWLARKVGRPRAARAVGRVMATNPLPIVVPCHRVVGSDGSLRGYGAGLAMKAELLRLEGESE